MKNHWVHDYETLKNCFVGVFEHYKSDDIKVFVIHSLRNDFDELIKFLETNIEYKEKHISFNGLAFDAQITEYILQNTEDWKHLPADAIAREIYALAQLVIDRSNNREWLDFYEGNMHIPQIDLYKLNHWNNKAKRSSLKWIQFSMDWYNLQDMPIEHYTEIHTQEELDIIIDYCINDVKSTKQILYYSIDQIKLRRDLSKEYNINLYSASEPKISTELFLHFLSKETKINKKELKQYRTNRSAIAVKDLILPYVNFQDPKLIELHEKFKEVTIDPENTKGAIKFSIDYKDAVIDYGLGGLHGATESGLYEAKEGMIIMSSDVKSYYPNLSIQNGWAPAHIPKDNFCKLYKWFYDERLKIPKSDIRNYVYKIILNSTYGLSNDKYSFLYDPQFTMQITINGQLSLTMLCEMLVNEIPGIKPLLLNTDGLEMMLPKEYKEKYLEICEKWEKMTDLVLEHDQYQKIMLADVNNYIAVSKFNEVSKEEYNSIIKKKPWALVKKQNDKYFYADTKCKGRFVFDGLPLHKNKSHLIVPKAVYNFFIHDMSPEQTIADNKNIFDYCIGKKIKGNWFFKRVYIDNDREYKEEKLQKTIRYYMTNNGYKILKCHKADGRVEKTEAKGLQQLFNVYVNKPWNEYDIDTQYYLNAIYKEIDNIIGKKVVQLTMF